MRACNAALDMQCLRSCNTECFSCGLPVCRSCSIVVPTYYNYTNKRIGVCCFRERFANGEELADWLVHTHAGYDCGPMPDPKTRR